ncbi:MAG: hypothetical protein R3286_13455, partial [Gammaproteobacteria bacterium]|nr:hypothetical protein [Gammaproteobacteria bacterium]
MQALLDLDLGWLVAWLTAIPVAAAAALYWITQRSRFATRLLPYGGVVAPFFTSVAIVFGMFAAFLGADIWQRVQSSNQSLEHEVAAVQSILQISAALDARGDAIASQARRYINATLSDELSRRGVSRSAVPDQLLGELAREILTLPHANDVSRVAQGAMLSAFEVMWQARATRRYIADTHSDPYKWIAVIVFGFLTQVALALSHLDKPKASTAALAVFTIAFALTLVALAMHE